MINQLRYQNHPFISVENQLVHKKCFFTDDVLACFKEWKLKALAKTDSSSDQCIWGNNFITGMWNKVLWNSNLINKGVMYMYHFF